MVKWPPRLTVSVSTFISTSVMQPRNPSFTRGVLAPRLSGGCTHLWTMWYPSGGRLSSSERGSGGTHGRSQNTLLTQKRRHPISLIAVSPSHPPIDRVWVECKTFPTLVRRCTHAEKDYFTLLLLLFVPSWVFLFLFAFLFWNGRGVQKICLLETWSSQQSANYLTSKSTIPPTAPNHPLP